MKRMFVIALVAVALLAASCARQPAPAPAPAPVAAAPRAVRVKPADISALKAEIESSRAKLAAYRALPPCAPSGAVECRDDDRADQAASAERDASQALSRVQRARERLPVAKDSARAFRAAVKNLPVGDPAQ